MENFNAIKNNIIPMRKFESPVNPIQQEREELNQLFGERDPHVARLVEERDERLVKCLMKREEDFSAVSKQRKKRKQRSENAQENQAGLSRGRGRSRGNGGKFPQHPLLAGNAAQKYAGMDPSDSPIAAHNEALEDTLLEVLGDAIQNNPELRLNPQMSNELIARIELYNQQKLQHSSTPKPEPR